MPLRELESSFPSHISAGPGYNELATAVLDFNVMPHLWFTYPRWSRVLAMAVSNIRRKLDWLASREGEKKP